MPVLPPSSESGWPAYLSQRCVVTPVSARLYHRLITSARLAVLSCLLTGCAAMAVVFCTTVALASGYWKVLVLLVAAHLPYLAFYLAIPTNERQTDPSASWQPVVTRQEIPAFPNPENDSLLLWYRIQRDGLLLPGNRLLHWERFRGFSCEPVSGTPFVRLRLFFQEAARDTGTLRGFLLRILWLLPPTLTFYIAWWGNVRFGWRMDVQAALSLFATYILVGISSLLLRTYMQASDIECIELLVDQRTMPAFELAAFLQERLPREPAEHPEG